MLAALTLALSLAGQCPNGACAAPSYTVALPAPVAAYFVPARPRVLRPARRRTVVLVPLAPSYVVPAR